MMRQRMLKVIGGCILAVVFFASGILMQRLRAASDQNVVTIGRVKIALVENQEDNPEDSEDGSAVEYVKPGQGIIRNSSILVLENSQPAYLRARLIITGLNVSQERELMESFAVEDDWVLNPEDGYYYYQYKVSAEDQIPFFDHIVVPERWENIGRKILFQIDVFAEAVEAEKVVTDTSDTAGISNWISYEKMSEAKSDVLNY